ncbi:MAG: M3 family oligoendopeptidase [Candidatus Hodarchaeota archaeon]
MNQYTPSRWNLKDLFPSHESQVMMDAFNTLQSEVEDIEAYREKLSPDTNIQEFMAILQKQEELTRLASRMGQFAELQFYEDTQNQEAQAFQAKMQQFMAEIQNRLLFFNLWWKGLSDEEAAPFIEAAKKHNFNNFLRQIRKFKPFTLQEAEEKIINIKNVTGVHALRRLYAIITNRYAFNVEVDGEIKKLNRGQLMSLVQTADSDLRARAYQELYRVYGDDGPILGQIYQALVRDFANENIDMRGYTTPISWRNLNNDIPDEVVHKLLDVAQKNVSVFQRYFKLKAKMLNIKKLKRYDIYAPVIELTKEYEYDYAVNLVLNTFNKFNQKIAALARRVFDDNHIDSQIRPTKATGAFCSSSDPILTPYVLINYNGKASDIEMLAHELGHAIHAMIADKHNVFDFHSSLPLAETASTFSEMLLVDQLLKEEADINVKRDILFHQVAEAYATIMRQIYFALFEREAHAMIMKDASTDDLNNLYMKNLETQFGDSVELSTEFQWEWVSVPHIYDTPFYVYAYAFGQLLVLALYKQFKTEGDSFIPRYLEILRAGGSAPPIEILDRAGVNIRVPVFWQGGFDVISEMIDKLENI